MLKVHHLNQSRSQRILWALEELGLPYQLIHYQREKNMLAPASLKKVHPLGKSPVLEDDDLIIAESGAILEYLQETYDTNSQLKPQERDASAVSLLAALRRRIADAFIIDEAGFHQPR
jgi:glutathione S-transferase